MEALAQTLEQITGRYRNTLSGALLVATGDGPVFSWANGYANRDFAVPNRVDTKFDTASITKLFTAAAVLSLVGEGRLSLEDPITRLADLSGTRISEEVTLRHLLTHTAGIADDADEEAGESQSELLRRLPNYAVRCCRDFLPLFAYKEPYFPPGTGERYNNCAFVLLGLAMEEVTGRDCREYIREAVFRPCGMERTGFFAKDIVEKDRAEGYIPLRNEAGETVSWRKNLYDFPPTGTPDGGAYSTVADLERFLRTLRRGELLPPQLTRELFRPQSPFVRESPYGTHQTGFGWEFLNRESGVGYIYKEGVNPGVEGMTAYFPHLDLSVHLLSNGEGALFPLFGEMRAALTELSSGAPSAVSPHIL